MEIEIRKEEEEIRNCRPAEGGVDSADAGQRAQTRNRSSYGLLLIIYTREGWSLDGFYEEYYLVALFLA